MLLRHVNACCGKQGGYQRYSGNMTRLRSIVQLRLARWLPSPKRRMRLYRKLAGERDKRQIKKKNTRLRCSRIQAGPLHQVPNGLDAGLYPSSAGLARIKQKRKCSQRSRVVNHVGLVSCHFRGTQRTSLHGRGRWWRLLGPRRWRRRRALLSRRAVVCHGPACRSRHDAAAAN